MGIAMILFVYHCDTSDIYQSESGKVHRLICSKCASLFGRSAGCEPRHAVDRAIGFPSFSAAFRKRICRNQEVAMGGPPPARGHRRLLHNGKCLNSQGFQGFRGCCDRVQRSPQAAPGRVVGKNYEFPSFPEVPAVRVSAPNGRCHLLHNGWCSTAPVH